jgi:hypothetical protein
MSVFHTFWERDKQRKLEFTIWTETENATLHSTWLSNEDYFDLNGTVNNQNALLWKTKHQHQFHEKDRNGRIVTVWVGVAVSSHGLIRPLFFSEIVNWSRYKEILQNDFIKQLTATQLPVDTHWIMDLGTASHTANVLGSLRTVSGHRIISHRCARASQVGKFGHPSVQTWLFFVEISWKRSCSQRKQAVSWTWQALLSSCAGGFPNTRVIVSLQTHWTTSSKRCSTKLWSCPTSA